MRYAFLVLLFALFLGACNLNKRADAVRLSKEIATINDSLNYYGKAWGEELNVAVNTRDFTHLTSFRQDIQHYINEKTIHVTSMKDIGGSKPLRQSMLDILKFENDIVLPKLAVFETFDATTPDDSIKKAFSNMIATTNEDLEKHNTMAKVMGDYAVKNDFPKPVDK